MWYKQWKSGSLSLGRSQEYSDRPEGAAPKKSLITRRTSCGKIGPDNSKAFPLFVRRWGSKTEEDAAEGLTEENPKGGLRLSLGTV